MAKQTESLTTRLDKDMYDELVKLAKSRSTSRSEYARQLISDALDDAEGSRVSDHLASVASEVAELRTEMIRVEREVKILRAALAAATQILLVEAGKLDDQQATEWVKNVFLK